jgi:hypothetical protein
MLIQSGYVGSKKLKAENLKTKADYAIVHLHGP